MNIFNAHHIAAITKQGSKVLLIDADAQKKELFARVRSGEVRVLFGSVPKMGKAQMSEFWGSLRTIE